MIRHHVARNRSWQGKPRGARVWRATGPRTPPQQALAAVPPAAPSPLDPSPQAPPLLRYPQGGGALWLARFVCAALCAPRRSRLGGNGAAPRAPVQPLASSGSCGMHTAGCGTPTPAVLSVGDKVEHLSRGEGADELVRI